MKTALINASPRGKISTSFKFLNEVKAMLPKDFETSDIQANKAALTEDQLLELKNSDIWIFANPLYIDSLPGHLLEVLEQIDASGIAQEAAHKHKVYAIINCGFYEPRFYHPDLSLREVSDAELISFLKNSPFKQCIIQGKIPPPEAKDLPDCRWCRIRLTDHPGTSPLGKLLVRGSEFPFRHLAETLNAARFPTADINEF